MDDDELTIHITREGRTATVAAAGEVDLSTVEELRTAVTQAAGGCDRLLLDLSEVGFIDSAGLGALLQLRAALQSEVASFQIIARDGPVREAVQITGLSQLLATS